MNNYYRDVLMKFLAVAMFLLIAFAFLDIFKGSLIVDITDIKSADILSATVLFGENRYEISDKDTIDKLSLFCKNLNPVRGYFSYTDLLLGNKEQEKPALHIETKTANAYIWFDTNSDYVIVADYVPYAENKFLGTSATQLIEGETKIIALPETQVYTDALNLLWECIE